jgi:hypothetical protein
LKTGSGFLLKRNSGEMAGRADARDAYRRLVWVGLEIRNQSLQIIRRQALPADDQ